VARGDGVDPLSRAAAEAADAADPLAPYRERFAGAEERIYLDGNSLGRLPVATRDRLAAQTAEWGELLVGGWPAWIDAPTRTGDLIAGGTNHEGLGPIQDGETLEMEIHGIGRFAVKVRDPLKRTWERGIYMGADSTHHEAVRRHRPQEADLLRPTETDPAPR